jgi:hypothetical protein
MLVGADPNKVHWDEPRLPKGTSHRLAVTSLRGMSGRDRGCGGGMMQRPASPPPVIGCLALSANLAMSGWTMPAGCWFENLYANMWERGSRRHGRYHR